MKSRQIAIDLDSGTRLQVVLPLTRYSRSFVLQIPEAPLKVSVRTRQALADDLVLRVLGLIFVEQRGSSGDQDTFSDLTCICYMTNPINMFNRNYIQPICWMPVAKHGSMTFTMTLGSYRGLIYPGIRNLTQQSYSFY